MEFDEKLVEKLIDKSKEAFLMAIEIYNKPSIKYRVEGFSFFICNAWELMLKAHLVKTKGNAAIYYKDNQDRTITLENCIRAIFTNEHSPMRKNLLRIVDLRNTSTHFIVEEYEMVYIPLFQACIFNYSEKMLEFHGIDMTQVVPQNFLTLSVSMSALNATEIRAKYPGQISEKLLTAVDEINRDIDGNNSNFAIRVEHHHYITKDKNKATDFVHIEKTAEAGVTIIKDVRDPNDIYKYTAKKCVKEINHRLSRAHIQLKYKGEPCTFNTYHMDLFNKYYGIKENESLCYVFKMHNPPTYTYSMQAIEFIVEEIKKDPENIVQNLKDRVKNKS